MNFEQWVTLVGMVCTIVVTVTTWGFLTGRWSSRESERVSTLERDFEEATKHHDRRFDDAGAQLSKAMSYIQGLESRFLREFATRELTDERFKQNALDHERFGKQLEHLERRHNARDEEHR